MRDPGVLGIVIGIFEIGCLMGALSCMYFGDRLGRRKTVVIGMGMLVVGGVLQTAAFNLGTLIAGRIISGIGLGIDVATIPTWQSECSKPRMSSSAIG
jgi:MFS family permease